MGTDPSTANSPSAPFEVYSLHFEFLGSNAIRLKDPESDDDVGSRPEWIAEPQRNEPAAYVQATRPSILVVFRGAAAVAGTYVNRSSGSLPLSRFS